MLQAKYSPIIAITIFLTLALLMLGAYTRLSNSGLGCPDWPGCYGKLTVSSVTQQQVADTFPDQPLEIHKAWIEMAHRYLAAIIGMLVLIITITSIYSRATSKTYAEVRPLLLPFLLLAVVVFQALLGMWTVTKLVYPGIVTAHLLGGIITFSLLWLLQLKLANPQINHHHQTKVNLGIWLVFIQIALGGWVSTNYSALACVDFPGCYDGVFFPDMQLLPAFDVRMVEGLNYEGGVLSASVRATIHMTHRIGALVVTVYLLLLFFSFVDDRSRKLRTTAWIMLLILIVQVSLGIANVYFSLPLTLAVLHNGVAAILFLSVIHLWFFSKKQLY